MAKVETRTIPGMEETILECGVRVSLTPSIGEDGLTAFALLCWLNKMMGLIPYQFRKSATVDRWDDHDNDPYLQVSYVRDHTEEESAELKANRLRYEDTIRDAVNRRREERERRALTLFENIKAIHPAQTDEQVRAVIEGWSDEERTIRLNRVVAYGYI